MPQLGEQKEVITGGLLKKVTSQESFQRNGALGWEAHLAQELSLCKRGTRKKEPVDSVDMQLELRQALGPDSPQLHCLPDLHVQPPSKLLSFPMHSGLAQGH